MKIGNNIKTLRQKNKSTQEQLANYLGVTYQAISKWETNTNTPDISLLPRIAAYFGVSIDALFSDNTSDYLMSSDFTDDNQYIKDDDVIRIVQMRGKQILKSNQVLPQDNPPIEIAFPHDCNDRTQYFKVEVFGNVISDSSINGDVVCHQSIQCGTINGDVRSEGDIKANEINSYADIICNSITDSYKLQCNNIECSGDVNSANLTCGQIIYKRSPF